MNVQKIVGWVIAATGFVLAVYAVESSVQHGVPVDRFAAYVGLGLTGFGTYIVAPTWLENLAQKCAAFLPWNKQPPAGQ